MIPIYLPIRAFGDFIITASVVKNNFAKKIPIILPEYLTELYEAIEGDTYFNLLNKISYGNQPAFFELYKVKDLQNVTRLIKDFWLINTALNKRDRYLVDYSSKRLFLTGARLEWPPVNENIYLGKLKLFAKNGLLSTQLQYDNIIKRPEINSSSKILIIPESRVDEKTINRNLVDQIISEFPTISIQVANFSRHESLSADTIHYSTFNSLIKLIFSHDLIISAESLPYHLANYLDKPHFVIYNKSRHFKTTFMTPFMMSNKYFSVYTGENSHAIINDIGKVIFADGDKNKDKSIHLLNPHATDNGA